MKAIWQLQTAKNKLSEVVKRAATAPQIITRHGRPVAVVQSYESWAAANEQTEGGLAKWLRSAPTSNLAEVLEEQHESLRLEMINDDR